MKGQAILQTRNLSVGYPDRKSGISLLKSLNLDACASDFIALVGVNGSGKSTLIRTLCGIQAPLEGEILLNSRPLKEYSVQDLARKIAFVNTGWIQVNNLRLSDLVRLGRYPYSNFLGRLSRNDKQICEEAIQLMGLKHLEHRLFDELSDGEKQRAMIARAIAQETEIILLDEPIAFLDMSHKFEIVRILSDLSTQFGKTILFSVHDLNIAIREADKIWMLNGQQILEGTPEDLMLSGTMQASMSGGLLEVDPQSGEFYLPKKGNNKVRVLGNGLRFNWVRRALIRMNFSLTDDEDFDELSIEVFDERIIVRRRNKIEVTCNSIEELSFYLHQN